jgi:hypothetical protein
MWSCQLRSSLLMEQLETHSMLFSRKTKKLKEYHYDYGRLNRVQPVQIL